MLNLSTSGSHELKAGFWSWLIPLTWGMLARPPSKEVQHKIWERWRQGLTGHAWELLRGFLQCSAAQHLKHRQCTQVSGRGEGWVLQMYTITCNCPELAQQQLFDENPGMKCNSPILSFVSLFMISVVHNQLRTKTINWKILERKQFISLL